MSTTTGMLSDNKNTPAANAWPVFLVRCGARMVGALGVVHDVSCGEVHVLQHLRRHLQLLRLRVLLMIKPNPTKHSNTASE